MTITMKRVLFCTIGFLAALVVWPVTELILYNQGSFTSYIMFSLIQGAILGLILGMFFGSIEGVLLKNLYFLRWGLLIGGFTGLVGGALGGVISQKILLLLAENENLLFLSRAIGLSILGVFIGITDGIRTRSLKKIFVGFLGGLFGGFIGGFVMEYLKYLYPSLLITRLLGIIIFTTLIGVFYALIEKKLSLGKLRVLNGKLKTKEFNIGQKVTRVGSSETCDINISSYENIEDHHITITEIKGDLHITKSIASYILIVNDKEVESHILKYEDVIKLGSAKLFYKSE